MWNFPLLINLQYLGAIQNYILPEGGRGVRLRYDVLQEGDGDETQMLHSKTNYFDLDKMVFISKNVSENLIHIITNNINLSSISNGYEI